MDREGLLVAALGAAVLAGCTREPTRPAPTTSPTPPPPDPDLATVTAWWLSERRLYDATPASYVPFRAAHRARLAAVEQRLLALGGTPPPTPPRLTGDLAGHERSAAAAYTTSLASVTDPDVVTLGAELAAGARQAAVVLGLAR